MNYSAVPYCTLATDRLSRLVLHPLYIIISIYIFTDHRYIHVTHD